MRWKKEALTALPDVFSTSRDRKKQDQDKLIGELYQQIGQLKVENIWLKKIVTIQHFFLKVAKKDLTGFL